MSKINDAFKTAVVLNPIDANVWKSTLLDRETINGLLSDIPFLHFIFDVSKIVDSISQNRFMKKCAYFICKMNDISKEECTEFYEELERNDKQNAVETIFGLLDRYDNINKVDVMMKLIRAVMGKNITMPNFLRLAVVLERIPFVDLMCLRQFEYDNYISGSTEILLAAGVISNTVIDEGKYDADEQVGEGGNKYRLNKLGVMLCKFGLEENVNERFANNIIIDGDNWGEYN